ncbi:uncharacterized protein [Physcomitrium patens]
MRVRQPQKGRRKKRTGLNQKQKDPSGNTDDPIGWISNIRKLVLIEESSEDINVGDKQASNKNQAKLSTAKANPHAHVASSRMQYGKDGESGNTDIPIRIRKVPASGEVRGSRESPWLLYSDGASVTASAHAGSGAVLMNRKEHPVAEFAAYIGPQRMNVAEYVGPLGGLRLAIGWKVFHLRCYGDSRVVFNQLMGTCQARRFKMEVLWLHAQELLKLFKRFVYVGKEGESDTLN